MVGIKFIADKAGVSTATVSRVMNKTKTVSPELEKKVLDAIIKYKYYPNTFARSLANKRSFLIGILIEESINQFQALILPKISQSISDAGYQGVISIVGRSIEDKIKVIEELKTKQVDGVIALFYINELEVKRIQSKVNIPLIYSEPLVQNVSYYEINRQAAYKAVKYLIELGHRQIAGLFSDTSVKDGYLYARYEGYKKACEEVHIPIRLDYCIFGDIGMNQCSESVTRLLKLPVQPTAIFCVSDELAIGTMFYLAQKGYKIPEDISIVGYDGIPLGKKISPKLTTIEQPVDFWLQRMVKGLINQIEKKASIEITEEEIQKNLPFLYKGESCKKL